MACIRDDGELRLRNELGGFNDVLHAHKIVVSDDEEDRRFDGSQLFFRESSPFNTANFVKDLRPVIWIGCHSLVTFSLKLDVVRGRARWRIEMCRFGV